MNLGASVQGRSISSYVRRGGGSDTVLVFGGFHGDEPKSVTLALRLIGLLKAEPTLGRLWRWVVVPIANPDGYERRKRRNANQVDINRNFPTENWVRNSRRTRMFSGEAPASEPETLAAITAIRRYKPSRIISIHSIDQGRECNNYDGPGRAIAASMRRVNGYPVNASIGYATPGSLGTWAGVERRIPTITLELPSRHSAKRCWEENREAFFRLI